MKVSFETAGALKSGAHAILVTQGALQTGTVQSLDATTGGQVTRALQANRFNGETGQVLEILAPSGLEASRLLLVGLGEAARVGATDLEKAGGTLYARLATSGETALTIDASSLEGVGVEAGDAAARLAGGALLRSYRFDRYRTKEPASKKPTLETLSVWTGDAAGAESRYARFAAIADGIFFTRDLVSEPGNVIYPKSFAERAQSLTALGVKVEVLGEAQVRELGFGALLGVAQGSVNEPQVVILEYDGTGGAGGDTPPVVFVGKGVTFDTGGISIKPAAGMEGMKWDMGGAGAVIGAVRALAARKARCRVVGLCGMVENMPSGTAQRPGDVVKSYSGQTIEVINTDAEGRLVLCDVMAYAQDRYKPKVLVDLATLTGAMVISLGHEYGGMFSNDDTLAAQLDSAGKATGDKLWRMPMGDAYDKLINTPIADMKNVGPREAGSITAAQFLKRFVKDGVAWAHLDIAGMVWSDKDTPLWEKGATGYGVRLLDQFIADNYEAR